MNAGSSTAGLQLVLSEDQTADFSALRKKLSTGSSVRVRGALVPSPGAGQSWELAATNLDVVGNSDADYPLQKKWHSPEFLRNVAHFRPRTRGGASVARVRSALSHATHEFFGRRGFIHVHTPVITACDAEGAGDAFEVFAPHAEETGETQPDRASSNCFFGKPAYLTVSGQLHAEAFACALGDVYAFGPVFRAEKSHTKRHLAELWMLVSTSVTPAI